MARGPGETEREVEQEDVEGNRPRSPQADHRRPPQAHGKGEQPGQESYLLQTTRSQVGKVYLLGEKNWIPYINRWRK